MEIEKLIEQLQKSADFEDYPVVASFAAIIEKKYLREAATALEQLQAENDRLQAELEKEEAARKKQADILYELRGQKYESTTAIDQLRAENERLKRERDAAVKDIWVPRWKSCKFGPDCDFISAVSGLPDCALCGEWTWRGLKEG